MSIKKESIQNLQEYPSAGIFRLTVESIGRDTLDLKKRWRTYVEISNEQS